jgi:hypothetical protein
MKFALVTTIRNEQDILNVFLNHIDALFDDVFLVDHRSVDRTSSILRSTVKKRKTWTYITLDVNGHYQKETSTLLMRYSFTNNADFVFFLDCDEFLKVKNREELEQRVKGLSVSSTGGSFRWINCVVDKLDRSKFKYKFAIWMNTEPSQFTKVFIPRSLYEKYNGNISVSQGNHQVFDPEGNVLYTSEIGHIIHLPVRSRFQLINKAIQSSLSNLSRVNRLPDENYQLYEILKMIANGAMSDDVIRGCIYLYQKEAKIIPISMRDLRDGKYQKTSLKDLCIATTQKFSFTFPHNNLHIIEQSVSDQILSWGNQNPENLMYDEKEGRISIGKQLY